MRFVKRSGLNMRVVAAPVSEEGEEEGESKTVVADVEEARNPTLVGGGPASKL